MSRPRLAVVGAAGRMGRAVVRLAVERGVFDVVCAVSAHDVGRDVGELAGIGPLGVKVVSDATAIAASHADAIVDFSSPDALPSVAVAAVSARAVLVSGTTGLSAPAIAALDDASRAVPVLWEPNMSVGVHALGELVRRAVTMLGLEYDVEIVETHHRAKIDAPSGTALRLAEVAVAARGDSARMMHGREGRPGARAESEIGMHAVRGGDVIGDHSVHLLGAGERIELVHRATSRDLFAHGALRAARSLIGRAPGRYAIGDVVTSPR